MKTGSPMRINGFDQIKAYYEFVFDNQGKRITPQHNSLYCFLWNQNNRNNWVEWFSCPLDLGMTGSSINSKKTYYKCLRELSEWGLIRYQKGSNEWRAPLISLPILKVQKCTSTVPQCTPLATPKTITLPEHLQVRDINLITINLNQITDNLDEILEFLKNELKVKISEIEKPQEHDIEKERIKKGVKLIADYFAVTEENQKRPFDEIANFVKYLAATGKIELLAQQFTAYRNYKSDPKYKHTWRNFIGTSKENYEDGAWNEMDWSKKSNSTKQVYTYPKKPTST